MKRIRAVRVVTAKHGQAFAAEWFDLSCGALEMVDVFATTGIMVVLSLPLVWSTLRQIW